MNFKRADGVCFFAPDTSPGGRENQDSPVGHCDLPHPPHLRSVANGTELDGHFASGSHRRISKDCFSSEAHLCLVIIRLESGGNQQSPRWSHWLRQMTYTAILYVGAKPARPAMNRMNPHIQRIVRFKRQPHVAAKACPPIGHAMQHVSEAGTSLMARFAFSRGRLVSRRSFAAHLQSDDGGPI